MCEVYNQFVVCQIKYLHTGRGGVLSEQCTALWDSQWFHGASTTTCKTPRTAEDARGCQRTANHADPPTPIPPYLIPEDPPSLIFFFFYKYIVLSFIQYLAEAKTRPDAMERIQSRALARMRSQSPPAKSPLASLNTHWAPDHGTKYWYHPDTKQLVPVWDGDDDGVHAETVTSKPHIFGITDEAADEMIRLRGRGKNPIHAAIRNGWVRLDGRGRGLTVQGTQAQAHKVIREHHAATGGAKPMYYVDHFVDGEGSPTSYGGMLSGAEQVEHYISHAGTPPMGAGWQRETDELN